MEGRLQGHDVLGAELPEELELLDEGARLRVQLDGHRGAGLLVGRDLDDGGAAQVGLAREAVAAAEERHAQLIRLRRPAVLRVVRVVHRGGHLLRVRVSVRVRDWLVVGGNLI